MKKERKNKPSHVSKGSVFDDLGFSSSESAALKIKAEIYLEIIRVIKKKGYTQKKLETILTQPQPRVSELLNGKISKMTADKLLEYLEALGRTISKLSYKDVKAS